MQNSFNTKCNKFWTQNCNNVLINCIIKFVLIVFLLISIYQINYSCGCFQNADRFSNKDNELQWAACVIQSVQETGRVKDPGGGYSL